MISHLYQPHNHVHSTYILSSERTHTWDGLSLSSQFGPAAVEHERNTQLWKLETFKSQYHHRGQVLFPQEAVETKAWLASSLDR